MQACDIIIHNGAPPFVGGHLSTKRDNIGFFRTVDQCKKDPF